ncbi:hypothetical protein J2W23_003649 [Variovorax boronicumulans]|uniref:DUF6176 family protein n=1 Tax=Variovorax boronicumulans TaxID=436515 RepID=UPI002782FCAE|nr:DUF6176 family protein [Variovorax boronicumulans]MDQ0015250.1 hypothetical protein [Variovorax boronicumulans]
MSSSSEIPVCVRVRLKSDSLVRVREWASHIAGHRDEALRTLGAESVTVESVFLESTAQGDFLIYYMRSASHDKARRVAECSTEAIDAYHQAFKSETWAGVERLELLLDLQR